MQRIRLTTHAGIINVCTKAVYKNLARKLSWRKTICIDLHWEENQLGVYRKENHKVIFSAYNTAILPYDYLQIWSVTCFQRWLSLESEKHFNTSRDTGSLLTDLRTSSSPASERMALKGKFMVFDYSS